LSAIGIVEETQIIEHSSFRPVSEVKGSKVINAKEENLGKIE
jgi:hypothetical protein